MWAAISANPTKLVVRRFDSVTGTVHWQRERMVITSSTHWGTHGPKIAIDAATGLIRVATSHDQNWLVVSYAEDGTPGPEVVIGEPDRDDVPLAIVATADGGFAVTGYEFSAASSGAIRTVALDKDNVSRFSDHEYGAIGSLFFSVPAWVAATGDGGLYVLGGPESQCGLFQFRLWKLDAAGQREWTVVRPEDPCDSFTPVGFGVLADGSVIIVSYDGGVSTRMAATRIGGDGQVRWHRSWDGTTGSAGAVPIAAAVNAVGRVRVVGFEPIPPAGGRYVVAEWTNEGSLCVAGHDPGLQRGVGIVALADGWLVGANGTGPGGTPDAFTLRYAAADPCTIDELFRDGFEAP